MKKLFFALILFITSCKKDFLEVPDGGVILQQDYVKNLKTLSEYLNGIYTQMGGLYDGYNYVYPEVVADNLKPTLDNPGNLVTHYNWQQQADNERRGSIGADSRNMNPVYSLSYKIVASCNFVIEEAHKYKSENEMKANDIYGQALALRSLIHFNLVNIFSQPFAYSANGSHPGIIYKKSSRYNEDNQRSTVAEVYGNLQTDMQTAISMLPSSPTNVAAANSKLVINRHAAMALLARIFLFKGNYEEAKRWAREVTAAIPLMSGADYPSSLFTPNESEALFQLPPAWDGIGGGRYYTYFAGLYFSAPLHHFNASEDIASVLQEDMLDVRSAWVVKQPSGNWEVRKYPLDVVPGFPAPTLSYYQTLLRSSEMYLTAAEAYAKLGNDDSARFFVNAIKLRANPSSTPLSVSGQVLLDSIYKERRKELAFEGLRMFDLQRNKQGVTRMDGKTLAFPSDKAIAPLPTSEIKQLDFTQNPSY